MRQIFRPSSSLFNTGSSSRVLPPLAAVMMFLFALNCAAQEDEHEGITEYEIACMPCHGADGRGNGPLAGTLSRPPADLTQIAKTNGGQFPADKVAEVVDGRAEVAAHGARDMPVWGDRYRAVTEAGEEPATVDERARSQIDALVRYLETIQEN